MITHTSIPNRPHLRERYLACWRGEVADGGIIAHIQNPNPNPTGTGGVGAQQGCMSLRGLRRNLQRWGPPSFDVWWDSFPILTRRTSRRKCAIGCIWMILSQAKRYRCQRKTGERHASSHCFRPRWHCRRPSAFPRSSQSDGQCDQSGHHLSRPHAGLLRHASNCGRACG